MCAVVARSTFGSQNNTTFGPFLDVEMLQKCAPLWCEAQVEVKIVKAAHVRTALGCSTSSCVAGARDSSHGEQRDRRSTLDCWRGKITRHIGTYWYEAVGCRLCTPLPFLKKALQNCFVFDVVNFEI